jgi:hypothetical protein
MDGTSTTRLARAWHDLFYLQGGQNGTETIRGNILIDGGLIKAIGRFPSSVTGPWQDLEVIDVDGGWVTPGSEFSWALLLMYPDLTCLKLWMFTPMSEMPPLLL